MIRITMRKTIGILLAIAIAVTLTSCSTATAQFSKAHLDDNIQVSLGEMFVL